MWRGEKCNKLDARGPPKRRRKARHGPVRVCMYVCIYTVHVVHVYAQRRAHGVRMKYSRTHERSRTGGCAARCCRSRREEWSESICGGWRGRGKKRVIISRFVPRVENGKLAGRVKPAQLKYRTCPESGFFHFFIFIHFFFSPRSRSCARACNILFEIFIFSALVSHRDPCNVDGTGTQSARRHSRADGNRSRSCARFRSKHSGLLTRTKTTCTLSVTAEPQRRRKVFRGRWRKIKVMKMREIARDGRDDKRTHTHTMSDQTGLDCRARTCTHVCVCVLRVHVSWDAMTTLKTTLCVRIKDSE